MRKTIITINSIIILLFNIGCENARCECKEVKNIYPQHATRAYVEVQCTNDTREIWSLHWSNYLTCGDKKYYAGDYISDYGTKKFEQPIK